MTTPSNDQKPKYVKKVPTEIEYHEKGHWTKGENILTVMGGLPDEPKKPIAFVKLLDYDENKKPVLVAIDLEGQELFERTSNLYQLKKQIIEQEQRLTKAMIIRENPDAVIEQEEPVQEIVAEAGGVKKENDLTVTRRRRAPRNNDQTISH